MESLFGRLLQKEIDSYFDSQYLKDFRYSEFEYVSENDNENSIFE